MRITLRDKLRLLSDSIEDLEELAYLLGIHRHRHRAHRLAFTFSWFQGSIQGENMIFTMPAVNAAGASSTVPVIGSPVLADGVTPSQAKLSSPSYASSDPTVFTVAADPATPNGAIITAVAVPGPGLNATATLTETATATEPDGTTTEVITGTATIVLTGPPVVVPPAAALAFTFGTPA